MKACAAAASEAANETQKQQFQKEIASIWSVFASCCVGAKDVSDVLPRYRKALLKVINDESNLEAGVQVAIGLAMLVMSNQIEKETKKEDMEIEIEKDMEIEKEEEEELEKLEKPNESKSKAPSELMPNEQSLPYMVFI